MQDNSITTEEAEKALKAHKAATSVTDAEYKRELRKAKRNRQLGPTLHARQPDPEHQKGWLKARFGATKGVNGKRSMMFGFDLKTNPRPVSVASGASL